jgi:MOSC domain-containing protein
MEIQDTSAQGSVGPVKHIGKVSHIAIYPVKGCARIELPSAHVSRMGLDGDREYMVVRQETRADGVHPFVTQRDKRSREDAKPQSLAILALIKPEIRDDSLRLTWKGGDPIDVARDQHDGDEMKVIIHKEVVSAVDQGEQVAGWLSEHLGLKVRLVRASGPFRRMARQNYMQNTNPIMFQDAYPIHWVMQESVDELSKIAGQEIPWTRFRPNIVGAGGEAQIEHEINEGMMGEVSFVQPKPCTRCPVTTVDQETGEKRGTEPLTSLTSYKRWSKTRETIFGENILPLRDGLIRLGDDISELSARTTPLVYG